MRAREGATSPRCCATGWQRAGSVHGEGPRRHDGHLGHHHPPDELRSGAEVSGDREHLRRPAGLVRAEDVQHADRHAGARRARVHRRADRRHGHVESLEGVPRHGVARTSATPASRIASSGTRPWPRSTRSTTSRASASTARRPAGRTRRAACCSIRTSTRSPYSNSGCHDNRMDKIWWNEQWMGWPLGPHYAASSNVDHAQKLKGQLHARSCPRWTRTSIRRRRCRWSTR